MLTEEGAIELEILQNTPIVFYIGEGNGTPLQYSCLENHMDRVWWATVHELDMTKRLTQTHTLWPFKKENYDS